MKVSTWNSHSPLCPTGWLKCTTDGFPSPIGCLPQKVTREWSDGVAAELIRNATRDNHNPVPRQTHFGRYDFSSFCPYVCCCVVSNSCGILLPWVGVLGSQFTIALPTKPLVNASHGWLPNRSLPGPNRSVSKDHHWVMFDGPVDALWIESLEPKIGIAKIRDIETEVSMYITYCIVTIFGLTHPFFFVYSSPFLA